MDAKLPVPAPIKDIFIPAREFRDPAWDARENDRLWPKVWQMACRESELAGVGRFVAYDILDESILIVRTGDAADDITAFYNVCQHRGRRLRDDKRGQLGETITCRFHGWQFHRNGSLAKAYMEKDWDDCPAFDRAKLSIPQVKVARWGGWIWINQDPGAEPLDEWLGAVREVLAPFHLDELRPKWWKTLLAPVNWKIVVEAFNEGYHSGSTHTSGVNYWPLRSPTATAGDHAAFFSEAEDFTEYRNPEGKWVRPSSFVENMWANNRHLYRTLGAMTLDPSMRASDRLLDLPPDSDPMAVMVALFDYTRQEIERSGAAFPATMTLEKLFAAGTDWHLFPNSIVLPTLDGALWYRIRPSAKDRDACIFDIWSFARYAPGEEPIVENEVYEGFDAFRGQCEFLEEDFANLEAVNRGVKSRGFSGATLNPLQEGTISNFHRVLRRYVESQE
jgi:phenylpropionate dioxygenase-like ring-hydroxylating dioxygenase large terminal subunit